MTPKPPGIEPAMVTQCFSEIVVNLRVCWGKSQRRPIGGDRFISSPFFTQRVSEIVMRLGQVPVLGGNMPEQSDRLIEALLRL